MTVDRMALIAPWECRSCGARYKAELSRCQRCHSTDLRAEGNIVPKISRDNDLATMEGAPAMSPPNERPSGEPKPREGAGGEQSSVGTDYSTSSESQLRSGEQLSQEDTSPAPTTGSLYQSDQETLNTADTAAGVTSEEPDTDTSTRRRRR